VTTWTNAQILLIGTILTTGKRTVTAALRVMGLKDDPHFAAYHHVLNRAVWSSLEVAQVMLRLVVTTLGALGQPLIFGLDDMIERRRGANIAARGIYRDPVRSSKSHFVKASSLRWLSLMVLTRISWAERVWALPVLTVLAPSERYYEARQRQPKTLTERA
jgi:hypothetical protein